MTGIREVAKRAGVGISTVSYALNGSHKVSEATRNRVIKIAKEIGYTPKLAARTLKGSKTGIIGVYIAGFQGEFYGELLDGMQHRLEKLGYDMVVTSGSRARMFLPERLFDAAIVMDNKFTDETLVNYLEAGSKIVVMDREIQHENARSVLLDNETGTAEAVTYLLSKKLKHYYIISGPAHNFDVERRLAAALKVFQENHQTVEVFDGNFTEQSGFAAVEKLLQAGIDRAGILALNDDEAVGFYKGMRAQQVEMTNRFQLVGFDKNHATDLLEPSLPSVSYHKHLWGEIAVDTLIQLLEEKFPVENQKIKTKLSFRE